MVETFMGQNFSSVLYFIGCDFCHLPNISSLLTDEVSIDKVCWDLLIDPEAFFLNFKPCDGNVFWSTFESVAMHFH